MGEVPYETDKNDVEGTQKKVTLYMDVKDL